jgi:hypothetical protein
MLINRKRISQKHIDDILILTVVCEKIKIWACPSLARVQVYSLRSHTCTLGSLGSGSSLQYFARMHSLARPLRSLTQKEGDRLQPIKPSMPRFSLLSSNFVAKQSLVVLTRFDIWSNNAIVPSAFFDVNQDLVERFGSKSVQDEAVGGIVGGGWHHGVFVVD